MPVIAVKDLGARTTVLVSVCCAFLKARPTWASTTVKTMMQQIKIGRIFGVIPADTYGTDICGDDRLEVQCCHGNSLGLAGYLEGVGGIYKTNVGRNSRWRIGASLP